MDRLRLSWCCCSCELEGVSLRFCGTLCCRAAALACSTLVSSGTNSSEKDLARLFCCAICLTKSLQSINGCDRTLNAMLRPHEGYLRWNKVYQREGSCPILKAISISQFEVAHSPPMLRTTCTCGIVGRQFLVVSIPMSRLLIKRIHVVVARLVIGPWTGGEWYWTRVGERTSKMRWLVCKCGYEACVLPNHYWFPTWI